MMFLLGFLFYSEGFRARTPLRGLSRDLSHYLFFRSADFGRSGQAGNGPFHKETAGP